MVEIIFSILISIISTSVFGFIINSVLFDNLLKNQSPTSVFHSSVFTGFMGLTIGTAIITTFGDTVFIISLLPIGLLLYRNFSTLSIDKLFIKLSIKKYLDGCLASFPFIFLALLFSLLLLVLKYDYFSADSINMLWVDFGFYINVAEYAGSTNMENTSSWYSLYGKYSVESLASPYHYGDIWIYRWISFFNVLQIPPIIYYGYVFTCLLAVFAYSSLAALIGVLFPQMNKIYSCLFVLLTLFCVPFDYYLQTAGGSILTLPKLFFFLVLLSYSVIFLYKEKYVESSCLLCIVPLAHIFYAPAVYTSIFLIGIVLLFYNRKNISIVKLEVIYILLTPTLCTLCIILFYQDYVSYFANLASQQGVETVVADQSIVRIIWDISKYHIWYWIAYFTLFLAYAKKTIEKNIKMVANLLILIVFFQITSFIVLFELKVSEANQIYMLLSSSIPIFLVLFVYILFNFYIKNKKYIYSIPFLLIILCSISLVGYLKDKHGVVLERSFVEKIIEKTKNVKNKQGIYYGSKKGYPDHYPGFAGGVGNILKMLGKEFWAINVNYACLIYEIENCDKILTFNAKVPVEVIKATPYYTFYESKKDSIDNEDDLQFEFIKEMKIEFIFALKIEDIPLKIREKATFTLTDPKAERVFLLLPVPIE